MPERLVKIALVAAIALYLGIVTLNNLTDYGSNFEFVRHVLSMDTTFPDNRLELARADLARHPPRLLRRHHPEETASTVAIAVGAWKLWQKRQATAAEFNAAKSFAVGALGFDLLLWFGGLPHRGRRVVR
jgi:predicted small integral membrane protein